MTKTKLLLLVAENKENLEFDNQEGDFAPPFKCSKLGTDATKMRGAVDSRTCPLRRERAIGLPCCWGVQEAKLECDSSKYTLGVVRVLYVL